MKKTMLFLLSAVLLFTTACNQKAEKVEKTIPVSTRDSLAAAINQRDNELNDMMSTFNDIQEGLRQITEAEGRVTIAKNNPEGKNTANIMEDISFIQRTMQLNHELINQLKLQVKGSTSANSRLRASLQTAISNLTAQLAEKDKQITELKAELAAKDIHIAEQDQQITNLNTNVTNLNSQNEEKAQAIAAQDREMNTAWYVFGTKRELKDQKILQSGDVLHSNQFNKDYFTRVDIRVDKVIRLYSKSARLLTSHPSGSYSLDRDAQKQYTLRIINPQQFWSVSRYLVVLVK